VSPTVVGTIFGVYLMGLCGTVFLVTNQATLSDLHGERRTIALAESNVAASSAAVTAPLAVGFADSIGIGWQWGILIAIPMFLVLSLTFRDIKLPKATLIQSQATNQQLPRVYWFIWAAMFLAVSVEWCVAYWGADYLDTVVGLETGRAATAMSLFFAAMVLGRFSGARLAHHYSSVQLLIAALIVALIGLPIFWLVSIPVISLAGLFVAGFGIANFYPLTAATATTAAPHLVDLAASRLAISGASALLVAPFLIGVFSDAVGIRWGFGIVIPFALAALIVTVIVKRKLTEPVQTT
jgi:fucose permease